MINALNRSKRLCETRRFRKLFRVFLFNFSLVFPEIRGGDGSAGQGTDNGSLLPCIIHGLTRMDRPAVLVLAMI